MIELEIGNRIFKSGDTGVFVGKVSENNFHSHYAVQLTIGLDKTFILESEGEKYTSKSLVVRPMVEHKLDSEDQSVLILLFNPASTVGHYIERHLISNPIQNFEEEWVDYLRMFLKDLLKGEIKESTFVSAIINSMAEFSDRCIESTHEMDKRVLASLQYLDRHARYIVSLEEIADEMCLSESRFQHLFKENTGITYRRMQLWKRLLSSFDLIRKTSTLTELAHKAGFSDSSHYSKTFKESFGFTPSEVFADSELIID